MAQAPMTEAQLREAAEAVRQYGDISAAARALKLPRPTLNTRIQRARQLGYLTDPPTQTVKDTVDVRGDDCEITKTTPVRVRTLTDLVRVCEVDTREWDVDRFVCNKWEMGSKDADGNAHVTELYQVKAWLKRKVQVIAARDEITALVADAKKQIPSRPTVKRTASGPHMLEIAIPDLHLGKLAWKPETGHANYDTRIAQDLFREALEALIARTASVKFDRIVFQIGSDFLHSDSKAGATTKGTPLDTDSRYHKSFSAGRRLMTEAIERLRQIAPMTVYTHCVCRGFLSVFLVSLQTLALAKHNLPMSLVGAFAVNGWWYHNVGRTAVRVQAGWLAYGLGGMAGCWCALRLL